MPPGTYNILGLGQKFIIVSSKAASKRAAITSAKRHIHKVGPKAFFVGEKPRELPATKLNIKFIWELLITSREIDRRSGTFEVEIKRLFPPLRKITPNLSNLQLKLQDKLIEVDSIVYKHSDNGLGIAAIALDKYIQ